MADPAFIQKLALEEVFTIGTALVWEVQQRRERFTKELDFVAINTLSLAAATGALVWLMAPNRASGVLKVALCTPAPVWTSGHTWRTHCLHGIGL